MFFSKPASSDPKEFGKSGEELAAKHLTKLGYKVLEKNYRTKAGEIDIIAQDGPTIVFVEVKSRRDKSYGPPEIKVDYHKRRQITRAALLYLLRKKKGNSPCRFDVVGISAPQGEAVEVTVIKDAFEMDGSRY
jgi:putative endonuclease